MMNTDLMVDTIDTHTAGEPTRLVTGGFDRSALREGTVREKRDAFAKEHDDIRKLLMKEPRGHDSMFGAIPVSPECENADAGLFFMDNNGYLDMCGHGTIGYLTAFLQTGSLTPTSELRIETPAGLVIAKPTVTGSGTVESVRLRNVVSFVEDQITVAIDVDSEQATIPVSIVYAGNFFAMVNVEDVPFSVTPSHVNNLVQLGLEVRAAVNDSVSISNPWTDDKDSVDLIEFYDSNPNATDRNLTVFGNGLVDRSPCGTGTCAKMALLHNKGELAENVEYHHESVIGTQFMGRILREDIHNGQSVIVPEITGSAYVTGKHTFVRQPSDPLAGFNVRSTDG
jgi:proline racemase